MSVMKMLNRIVAPSELDFEDAKTAQTMLHDHTYGISKFFRAGFPTFLTCSALAHISLVFCF